MCVKIRLESVSVSVSVSVSEWLQVFHNHSPPGDGYGRPSVTIQTHRIRGVSGTRFQVGTNAKANFYLCLP